jgi:hypothetical protein
MTYAENERDAQAWIAKARILATEPGFQNTVHIVHDDGSVFFLRNAFALRHENVLVVIAEHHRELYFPIGDLEYVKEFGPHPVDETLTLPQFVEQANARYTAFKERYKGARNDVEA